MIKKLLGGGLIGSSMILNWIIALFLFGGWIFGIIYNFNEYGLLSGLLMIPIGFIIASIAYFFIGFVILGLVYLGALIMGHKGD